MDVPELVKNVVAFLAPALPYLVGKIADAAAEVGVEKIGEKAWQRATALWTKLRGHKEVEAAAQEVAAAPQDEDAQAALRLQVRKLLMQDAALAQEVAQLWQEVKSADVNTTVIASGDRSVAAGGAISGTVITGDQTVHQQGKYNIHIDEAKGTVIGDNTRVEQRFGQE